MSLKTQKRREIEMSATAICRDLFGETDTLIHSLHPPFTPIMDLFRKNG